MNARVYIVLRLAPIILILLALIPLYKGWKVSSLGTKVENELTLRVVTTEISPQNREAIPADAWTVFKHTNSSSDGDNQNQQFRLAGTFFVMGTSAEGRDGQRLAIIDDLISSRQHIVSEGQTFDGYEILRIYQERLIMRRDGMEIELTLSFKGGVVAKETDAASQAEDTEDPGETALESNRFGKRIGETRWVIQKQALVDYYQELLDEPERIAAIYMSLKPDYQNGEIAGYYLEKEGEADFFNAVGLQEGDRIRAVNSMKMISQARAEYFISEFMQERLNAVVLDVERNGQQEKLIYLLR